MEPFRYLELTEAATAVGFVTATLEYGLGNGQPNAITSGLKVVESSTSAERGDYSSFASEAGFPGMSQWDYPAIIEVDVGTDDGDITWGFLDLAAVPGTGAGSYGGMHRANSALSSSLEQHEQTEGAFTGTGVKRATFSSTWSSGNTTDRIVFIASYQDTRTMGGGTRSVDITVSQHHPYALFDIPRSVTSVTGAALLFGEDPVEVSSGSTATVPLSNWARDSTQYTFGTDLLEVDVASKQLVYTTVPMRYAASIFAMEAHLEQYNGSSWSKIPGSQGNGASYIAGGYAGACFTTTFGFRNCSANDQFRVIASDGSTSSGGAVGGGHLLAVNLEDLDAVHLYGTSHNTTTTSLEDLPLGSTNYNDSAAYSVSSGVVTVQNTDTYLVAFAAALTSSGGNQTRLVSGGSNIDAINRGDSTTATSTIAQGLVIQDLTANDTAKLQGASTATAYDFNDHQLLMVRLPSGAHYGSFYESSVAARSTAVGGAKVSFGASHCTASGISESSGTFTITNAGTYLVVADVAFEHGATVDSGSVYFKHNGNRRYYAHNNVMLFGGQVVLPGIFEFAASDTLEVWAEAYSSSTGSYPARVTFLRVDNLGGSDITVTATAPSVSFSAGSATVSAGSSAHTATAPSANFTATDATAVPGTSTHVASAPSVSFVAQDATASFPVIAAAAAPSVNFTATDATAVPQTSTHVASGASAAFTALDATAAPGASTHIANAPTVAFTAGAASTANGASTHAVAVTATAAFTATDATAAPDSSSHIASATSAAFTALDATAAPGTSSHIATAPTAAFASGTPTVAAGSSSHIATANSALWTANNATPDPGTPPVVTVTPTAPAVSFTAPTASTANAASTHVATAPSAVFTATDATVAAGASNHLATAPSVSFTATDPTTANGSSDHAATAPSASFTATDATVAPGTSSHVATSPSVSFVATDATAVPGASTHVATAASAVWTVTDASVSTPKYAQVNTISFVAGTPSVAPGASSHLASAPSVAWTVNDATVVPGTSTHIATAPSAVWTVVDATADAGAGTITVTPSAPSAGFVAGTPTAVPGTSTHVATAPSASWVAADATPAPGASTHVPSGVAATWTAVDPAAVPGTSTHAVGTAPTGTWVVSDATAVPGTSTHVPSAPAVTWTAAAATAVGGPTTVTGAAAAAAFTNGDATGAGGTSSRVPSAPVVAFASGTPTVVGGSSSHAATAPTASWVANNATAVVAGFQILPAGAPSVVWTANDATFAPGASTHVATAPTATWVVGNATAQLTTFDRPIPQVDSDRIIPDDDPTVIPQDDPLRQIPPD